MSDARVTADGPKRSRTASSAASSPGPAASSSGSASWPVSSSSRPETLTPSRVRPRSRIVGPASSSSSRTAASTGAEADVGRRIVRERVAAE